MKIYAPVKDACGTWASVQFVNGVGETDDPVLIEWFRSHGYKVPLEETKPVIEPENKAVGVVHEVVNDEFEDMTPNELREWMKANGYGSQIKNIRNKEKLLEIIRG